MGGDDSFTLGELWPVSNAGRLYILAGLRVALVKTLSMLREEIQSAETLLAAATGEASPTEAAMSKAVACLGARRRFGLVKSVNPASKMATVIWLPRSMLSKSVTGGAPIPLPMDVANPYAPPASAVGVPAIVKAVEQSLKATHGDPAAEPHAAAASSGADPEAAATSAALQAVIDSLGLGDAIVHAEEEENVPVFELSHVFGADFRPGSWSLLVTRSEDASAVAEVVVILAVTASGHLLVRRVDGSAAFVKPGGCSLPQAGELEPELAGMDGTGTDIVRLAFAVGKPTPSAAPATDEPADPVPPTDAASAAVPPPAAVAPPPAASPTSDPAAAAFKQVAELIVGVSEIAAARRASPSSETSREDIVASIVSVLTSTPLSGAAEAKALAAASGFLARAVAASQDAAAGVVAVPAAAAADAAADALAADAGDAAIGAGATPAASSADDAAAAASASSVEAAASGAGAGIDGGAFTAADALSLSRAVDEAAWSTTLTRVWASAGYSGVVEEAGGAPADFLRPTEAYAASSTATWLKRVRSEYGILHTGLPAGTAVFRYTEDPSALRLVMAGFPDTPYVHSVFVFDITLPPRYPAVPPVVLFRCRVGQRLNPNLYANGKVCLSLLGTWGGEGASEEWGGHSSTLLQVVVSLQAMVVNKPKPYFNEPGAEALRGSPEGDRSALEYNESAWSLAVQSARAVLCKPCSGKAGLLCTAHLRASKPRILGLLHRLAGTGAPAGEDAQVAAAADADLKTLLGLLPSPPSMAIASVAAKESKRFAPL
jgi:ubiquitin-protein ligase